ncbi:MAG TPA: ABC-type transport auxiliary lipoprotein family protein [candidate division Zixibacteria bacterium]|nr:ABC-type transport auxiliary lipoprotein family protein [candidate division Zixibacteria bacterium]
MGSPEIRRIVALTLAVAWVSACAVFPEAPNRPTSRYRLALDGANPVSWPQCPSPAGVLVVSALRDEAAVASNGIAYLLRPHEVKYYAYSQWVEDPARQLLPLVIQALERTNCWTTVTHAESGLRADYRLDAEILQWQQEFFPTPSRVRLAFRAELVAPSERAIVASRRFELVEEAETGDAYGAVIASNRAVNRWLLALAEWAKAAASQRR